MRERRARATHEPTEPEEPRESHEPSEYPEPFELAEFLELAARGCRGGCGGELVGRAGESP